MKNNFSRLLLIFSALFITASGISYSMDRKSAAVFLLIACFITMAVGVRDFRS